MNNLVLYIIVFSGFILKINAQQNLVPNPSFEDYSDCPYTDGQLEFAEPWRSGGASPDFFHECSNDFSSTIVGVPENFPGNQTAHTGLAYAGLSSYSNYQYREYIQSPLSVALDSGSFYMVKFHLSLADGSSNAINSIGLLFSKDSIYSNTGDALDQYAPQVLSEDMVTNKNGWTEISGCYLSVGGEKFITIGNFNNNENTETQYEPSVSGTNLTYYYIDQVSVVLIEDSASCVRAPVLEIPNVFTPNGDEVNDNYHLNFKHLENLEFVILNRWGNVVFEGKNNDSWDGTNRKGNELSEGVYFLKASYIDPRDQQTKTKTGFVHLIR
ncbi:MAG: gliding motility-associated C-terminal domain-containing protein [Bacteroidota bacterium]